MANTKAEAPIWHHFPEETANYLIAGWLHWIPSVTGWVAICLHCNRHVFWMCICMFCPQCSAIILYHYCGLTEGLTYQQSIPYNFAFCFWPRKHFKGKKQKRQQRALAHETDWSYQGIIQKELTWQKSVMPYQRLIFSTNWERHLKVWSSTLQDYVYAFNRQKTHDTASPSRVAIIRNNPFTDFFFKL